MQLKKSRSEITIEALNIKLHYPSQKSEDKVFVQLEFQSKNSFSTISSMSPARSPVMFRSSSTPSLFRETQTPSPMPEERTITPASLG